MLSTCDMVHAIWCIGAIDGALPSPVHRHRTGDGATTVATHADTRTPRGIAIGDVIGETRRRAPARNRAPPSPPYGTR